MIVLASSSPRRLQLLSLLGIQCEVVASIYQEKENMEILNHCDMAMIHATEKAREVYNRIKEKSPVLAADTIVTIGQHRMGKPRTAQEAVDMLSKLSGKTHQVITAMCLVKNEQIFYNEQQITNVTFRNLEKHEIIKYVETKDPLDKAGAYGIQGPAACFVESIHGCYYNVMGLPLSAATLLLRKVGIDCPEWRRIG